MLDATVETISLLRGGLAIQSVVLYKPVIDIISDPDGLWNYQNPAGPKQGPLHVPTGETSSLQIKNGVLQSSNLIDPADTPGPVVLEIRNFSAQLNQIHFHPLSGSGAPASIAGDLAADGARFGSIHTKELHAQLRITSGQLTFKGCNVHHYAGCGQGRGYRHDCGQFRLRGLLPSCRQYRSRHRLGLSGPVGGPVGAHPGPSFSPSWSCSRTCPDGFRTANGVEP